MSLPAPAPESREKNHQMPSPLWITYAWADNAEGDFDYLVQRLSEADITSLYDKIALVPGRKLWAQIANKIEKEPLSGWAYLITPQSLASPACQEEQSYALQRALETKGQEFPLIGLLHQASLRDVPLALRVRVCVNLANPDWIEEVRAAVVGQPPRRQTTEQSQFVVKVHNPYLGNRDLTAVEFRPRFGEIGYWRIAFPANGPRPASWCSGPANGGGVSGAMSSAIDGKGLQINGILMDFVGAGNTLTAATSAYAVFIGPLPSTLFFGISREPFSTEMTGTLLNFGKAS
jgi:hypothetical protein